MGAAVRAARAGGVCLVLALLLAACGASNSGDVLGNLLAFNSVGAPPSPAAPKTVALVDCPVVNVDDANATVRVYAGADQSNQDVRYQYDIGQVARQCEVENGQIAIKVGVEGRVLIGPQGSAGSFVAPVRIAITRDSDNQTLADKVYPTAVTVQPGVGETVFDTVSEPFLVPYTGEHADQVYSITVGFAQAGAAKKPVARARRRRRG